jgi:hypothetical protein
MLSGVPFTFQGVNKHVAQHIIQFTDWFPVTETSIAIDPVPKHIFPILSGQWKEITLSGMPLHIPSDQCTCCTTYNMIHRSIPSDLDINSHWSSTQTYFSDSIRSMERNYIEWDAPSHSSVSINMLHTIKYNSQINFSDLDINSHWSSTQPYFSNSIRSMERNHFEWNAPSNSSRSMHMLHNI